MVTLWWFCTLAYHFAVLKRHGHIWHGISLWHDLLWPLVLYSIRVNIGNPIQSKRKLKGIKCIYCSCFQVYMLVSVAAITVWLTVFAAVMMYWRTISLFVPKSFSLSGVFFSSLRFISSWKHKPIQVGKKVMLQEKTSSPSVLWPASWEAASL